jgi:hypothetical protein
VAGSFATQKFARRPCRYLLMISSGMMVIPTLMKIKPLAQKLLDGQNWKKSVIETEKRPLCSAFLCVISVLRSRRALLSTEDAINRMGMTSNGCWIFMKTRNYLQRPATLQIFRTERLHGLSVGQTMAQWLKNCGKADLQILRRRCFQADVWSRGTDDSNM